MDWQTTHILLGTGGSSPGLAAYDLLSNELIKVLPLTEGDSVYSIAVCPDDGTVAIGTKSGRIYLLGPSGSDLQVGLQTIEECETGAPVLSVCFVGPSTLAVSDVAGGFLLWQIGKSGLSERLWEGTAVVYGLFHPDSKHLAGLSMSGELLIWDLSMNQLVGTAAIPKPPEFAALIRPLYWPQEGLWVWPGQGGLVVTFDPRKGTVQTFRAHAGDFYAITICDGELITVGVADHQAKRWQPGRGELAATLEAPDGMISATVWGQRSSRILFVDKSGRAAIYCWSSEQLELVSTLPGRDYRAALGPDPAEFESARLHHQAEQARELARQADEQISRRRWDALEPIYQQLTDHGYPHVMLALRGRQAHMCDDPLGELRAYHELAGIIPHDQEGSRNALQRYAELLESVWNLQSALSLYQQLAAGGSGSNGYTEKIRRLSDLITVMESKPYVIEAEAPLSLLVEADTVLGEKFTGRYQLMSARPAWSHSCVSIDAVMKRYKDLVGAVPQSAHAEKIELCWLSRDKKERINTIMLGNGNIEPFPQFELVIRFFDVQMRTVLAPTIILNADVTNEEDVEQHNRAILGQLQRAENAFLLNSWYQMRLRDIKIAIRQLVTRGMGGMTDH